MRQSRRTIESTRHIADLVKQPNVHALNLKDERIRGEYRRHSQKLRQTRRLKVERAPANR